MSNDFWFGFAGGCSLILALWLGVEVWRWLSVRGRVYGRKSQKWSETTHQAPLEDRFRQRTTTSSENPEAVIKTARVRPVLPNRRYR